MPKPINEQVVELLAQWLYEEGAKELPADIEDVYFDAADALLDLLAYWRGYEDE